MNMFHLHHVPMFATCHNFEEGGPLVYSFKDNKGNIVCVAYHSEADIKPAWKRVFPAGEVGTVTEAITEFVDRDAAATLQRLADRTLAPTADQKPADHGLFDDAGRAQLDLVEIAGRG